ncbi:hypothetical protein TRM7557_01744 [Tritonibacter multivorans]|uniref:Tat pathway signal sequence domain protein n=1 Tax=Tritonibacter multivorans TaxID=928856 RepID=A0A0N7LZN3_9RHOB|nr:hypothetical protein [Tritonibacter multivorans]MDA7422942.1 hypothetical protein [Tritonibacter multivorans]CUH78145.1 hypothetical protein TRM7557_01744 [Tritonibacter multivorans]SFD74911.1 hypothetical protein SAMN04488049_1263 [Tritonibacter multivorans]
MFRRLFQLFAFTCFSVVAVGPAMADPAFLIELNKATEKNTSDTGACEIVIFAHNRLGTGLKEISFKLAVVDSASQFNTMLSLPLGAMRINDSKFASYTLKKPCGEISKVVINDVHRCLPTDGEAASDICNEWLEVNSLEAEIEMAL